MFVALSPEFEGYLAGLEAWYNLDYLDKYILFLTECS